MWREGKPLLTANHSSLVATVLSVGDLSSLKNFNAKALRRRDNCY